METVYRAKSAVYDAADDTLRIDTGKAFEAKTSSMRAAKLALDTAGHLVAADIEDETIQTERRF